MNEIIKFIEDLPNLIMILSIPGMIITLMIMWLLCYKDYKGIKDIKVSFWRFAYYWWYEVLFRFKRG